LAEESSKKP